MTRHRAAKLDRDAAERLLAGARAARLRGSSRQAEATSQDTPQVEATSQGAPRAHRGVESLAAVLAAAAAPARGGAVPGEEAALAAFRAARVDTEPARRRSMLGKLLTLKVAVGAAAAMLAAGGAALAANSGALPGTVAEQAAPPASTAPHASRSPSHGSASPSPSLPGLCQAYDKVRDNPGKALRNPAFGALIEAAGGKDKVGAYCDKVLADKSKRGRGAAPDNRRTGGPRDHPSGPPATKPGK